MSEPSGHGGFYVRDFFVPDRVIFVGHPPQNLSDPVAAVEAIRPMVISVRGQEGTVTPVFTDAHLARLHIQWLGDEGVGVEPLAWNDKQGLAHALAYLTTLGETDVIFDPEPTSGLRWCFPIPEVLDAIARSLGQ